MYVALIIIQIFCWVLINLLLINSMRLNDESLELNRRQIKLTKKVLDENLELTEKVQELRFEKLILEQKIEKVNEIATSNTYGNNKVTINKIKEVIQSANKNNF